VGPVTWRIADASSAYTSLVTTAVSGNDFVVTANNTGFVARTLVFEAVSQNLGLQGSIAITVNPEPQAAPGTFFTGPTLQTPANGKISVAYSYAMQPEWEDWSVVNWYRCDDSNGSNPVLVAVTRNNNPLKEYTLQVADIGKYIKVEVEAKHSLSQPGGVTGSHTWPTAIANGNIGTRNIHLAFENLPTDHQLTVAPGLWTLDRERPLEHQDTGLQWNTAGAGLGWAWNASQGNTDPTPGFRHANPGGRIRYTPPAGSYTDMDVTWVLGSGKEGQGFGSATCQYMDLFIKFDNVTGNGYALRIQRTNRQSNGTEWGFVKYVGWDAYTIPVFPRPSAADTEDTRPTGVTLPNTDANIPKRKNAAWWDTRPRTSAFMTFSTIRVWTQNGKLYAQGSTSAEQSEPQESAGLTHSVYLEWDGYEPNTYGGFGLWQNGTSGIGGLGTGDATTSLRTVDVVWAGVQ
jgi:hypothetical protein